MLWFCYQKRIKDIKYKNFHEYRDNIVETCDTCRTNEEENFPLAGKGMKSKRKKAQGKVKANQNYGKMKYLNKIKFCHRHEYGHYATKCPHKKSSKKRTTGTGDAFTSQLELDFTLIS